MILCSRIDSILNRLNYQGLMRLKAKIILFFFALFSPVLLSYFIYNLKVVDYLFAALNFSILVFFAGGFFFFVRGRWEALVNVSILCSVAAAQFCFIYSDYISSGLSSFSYFYFGSVHSCVALVLVGVYATRLYQIWLCCSFSALFLVYHLYFSYGYMNATPKDAAGILCYFVLSAGISFIIFRLFKHHDLLISEKEKMNHELAKMAAVKDDFLANVSHEMRNPLNALNGMTELLLDSKLVADQRRYVENIRSCNTILLLLINNVLDMNKLETSQYRVKSELCNVAALLEDISRIYESRRSEEISFCYKAWFDRQLWCNTDSQLITQVVVNLLDNAFKFTDSGHIMLMSWLNGKRLAIEVSDSGIGMSADVQSKIFDRFYQGTSGYSKKFKGTGIGLSVVRDIVAQLRGDIEVKSREGIGSVFKISIPLDLAEGAITIAEPEIRDDQNNTRFPVCVYIAEDEPMNRMYLESVLSEIVDECRAFENGKLLCDAVELKVPDVIMLDMQMPVMNGFECIDYFKKRFNGEDCRFPIVATTGYSFPVEVEKIRQTGVEMILSKPLSGKDVRIALQKVLNGSGIVK